LIIKGLTNPDYHIELVYPKRIRVRFPQSSLKAKLIVTYFKMNYDFDGADIYDTSYGFSIYGTHLRLRKNLEFDLWITRSIESIEKGLKEFDESS
jgi:hypothetical protein